MAETITSAGPSTALRLIRDRNFGPYFVGNATSASGTWFQNLAASIYVFQHTHSPFLLGVLQFGNFIPVLLLAPWGGSAADRFDRKQLLLATQIASTVLSAVLAALAWAGLASVPLVIGCAVGLGISSAFSAPASQALIGDLVLRRDLQSAVALNSMTFNLARAIGPTLGGISVDQLGFAPSFAINAASYLVLVLGLTLVQPRARELAGRGAARLRESLRLVREQPRLLAFLLIVTAVGFASDPVNTLSPAFAHEFALDPPSRWAGIIVGASGAGAVTAAFVVAGRVAGSRWRMAATLSMLAAGIVGFSLSRTIWLGLAFLVVGGFGFLASNASATSRLQLDVAEHQRGRIMALWSVAFLGLRPAASLLDGALADAFGVRTAGVVLALPAFACAVAILAVPRLARYRPASASGPRNG